MQAAAHSVSDHRSFARVDDGGFLDFSRYALALMRGNFGLGAALAVAESSYEFGGRVETVLRAASSAGSTTDSSFAASLAHASMVSAFIASLRGVGVLDSVWGAAVRVPPMTYVAFTTTAVNGDSTSEQKPKAVHSFVIDSALMTPKKSTAICVLSRELLQFSDTMAVDLLNRELRSGVIAATDAQLLTDITTGLTPISASGTTAAAFQKDLGLALASMTLGADSKLYLVLPTKVVQQLAIATTTGGAPAFPDLRVDGGSIAGIPVIPSDVTPSGNSGVLIDAAQLALAQQRLVLDSAEHASVQLNTAPDDPTATTTALPSLWQRNEIALRCERYAAWQRLRASGCAIITNVAYVAAP
jgi:HK97 family phage major capsid protein